MYAVFINRLYAVMREGQKRRRHTSWFQRQEKCFIKGVLCSEGKSI